MLLLHFSTYFCTQESRKAVVLLLHYEFKKIHGDKMEVFFPEASLCLSH